MEKGSKNGFTKAAKIYTANLHNCIKAKTHSHTIQYKVK